MITLMISQGRVDKTFRILFIDFLMIAVMILQGGEDKTLQIYMDKAFLPVWVMVCLIAVLLCMVTIIIIITISTTTIT